MSNNNWITPKWLIEKVVKVLGPIEFDPYSSVAANVVVNADFYRVHPDDHDKKTKFIIKPGEWPHANTVWMNPPYSFPAVRDACQEFLRRFADRFFERGMVLVNSGTDTEYYQALVKTCNMLLIFNKRISFLGPTYEESKGNLFKQTLFYFDHEDRDCFKFQTVFSECGTFLRYVPL